MTDLYIIGTGGAAKEIIQLVEQINAAKPSFVIKGFVDLESKSDTIDFFGKSYCFFEESKFLQSHKGAAVIIAHGLAAFRNEIFNKFTNFEFPNVVHPLVDIHSSVHIGKGNIIKMGCLLTTDITMGDNNYINRGTQVGHDVLLGNHNVLNPGCVLSGGINMGNSNNIGANGTILQFKKIGNKNTLGANAVLVSDVENNKLLVGIPAKEKN